ncbi:MAG: PAS domain S-box protein [Candidatus Omnitrophica bacterium]|nr:PAS domain S-box protein [Candidatus Omnitrophota bacterium]MDD5487834.1 PAS domain S-box protein [Candidatus Omnitrophota bacterium]
MRDIETKRTHRGRGPLVSPSGKYSILIIFIVIGAVNWVIDGFIEQRFFGGREYQWLVPNDAAELFHRVIVFLLFVFSGIFIQLYLNRSILSEKETVRTLENYNAMFNVINDAVYVYIVNDDGSLGNFIEVNDTACRVMGYTREEFMSMTPRDLDADTWNEERERAIRELRASEKCMFRIRHRTKSGAEVPVEINSRVVTIGGRKIIISIARDLRVRQEIEARLEESNERFRLARAVAKVGVWDLDMVTGELKWSEEVSPIILGMPDTAPGENKFRKYVRSIHRDDRKKVAAALRRSARNGEEYAVEHRVVTSDGGEKWVLEAGNVMRDQSGKPVRIIGIVRDISEYTKTRIALRSTLKEKQAIFDAVPAGVFYKDNDNTLISVNNAFCKITEMRKEELEGKNCADLWPTEAERYGKDDQEVIRTGQPKKGIVERLPLAGGNKWLYVNKIPYRDDGGKIRGVIAFASDITDMMKDFYRAEQDLELLQTIIDAIPNPVFYKNSIGMYMGCNKAFMEFVGKRKEEIIGKTVYEVSPREFADKYHEADQELVRDGGNQVYEAKVVHADGTERAVMFYKARYETYDRKQGMVGVMLDITEAKKIEEALIEAKNFGDKMLRTSPSAIFTVDVNKRVITWNKRAEQITGYTMQEVIGKECLFFSKAPCVKVCGLFSDDVEKPVIMKEATIRHKDGHTVYISKNADVLRDTNGEVVGGIEIFEDITERKRYETELRESKEKFQGVVDNIGVGVALIGPGMEVLTLNRKMKEWFPDVDPETKPICYQAFNRPPRDNICTYCPTCLTFRDGERHEAISNTPRGDSTIHYRIVTSPVKDDNGDVVAVIDMVEDITEKKKAEEYLKTSEEQFRAMIERSVDGIVILKKDGECVYANPAAERLFKAAAYKMDKYIHLPKELPDKSVETSIERSDGDKLECELIYTRITWRRTAGILVVIRDIGERKEVERKTIQTEKLASIGQIAAGVAHEINNPISFIGSNLTVLSTYVHDITGMVREMIELENAVKERSEEKIEAAIKSVDEKRENIDLDYIAKDVTDLIMESNTGIERIKKIVYDLKTFSRPSRENLELVSLNEVIDGVINIVWNEIKYKAELIKEYGQLPSVKCDVQQMGQVFINLLVNAGHAIEARGAIVVRTYARGSSVVAEVVDSGRGIDPEVIEKVFEPFFSTKEKGEGTGLGLSITHGIIKKHNGTIDVESEPGKGTCFRITLPAVYEKVQ